MGNHWAIAACCAALCGCPTVDLGPTPEDIAGCNPAKGEAYFESDIWPKYVNNTTRSCIDTGCHVPGGNGGTMHFDPNVPAAFPDNYKLALPQLNCQKPDESPFLTKPLAGQVAHGGMDIFQSLSDPAVVAFLAWFE